MKNWRDTMKNWLSIIRWRYEDFRYAFRKWWQRMLRGYADSDLWNMDYALAEYLHRMMDKFIQSKRMSYYPVNSCLAPDRIDMTEEERDKEKQDWESILIKIREGFKAAKDISSDSYFEIEDYPMRKDSKGKILPIEWEAVEGDGKLSRMKEIDDPEHEDKLKTWNKHYEVWREERNKTFEEGMDLFKKYFFALWD